MGSSCRSALATGVDAGAANARPEPRSDPRCRQLEDFFALDFLLVDFLAEDFFALDFFAGALLAAPARFAEEVAFALERPRVRDAVRFAAEATLCATFGALSLIALPIWGARFATWSPAARIALPTLGGVLEAILLAALGALSRTVRAIFGARSATALPTAGALSAMPETRSPSLSAGPFDLFSMR